MLHCLVVHPGTLSQLQRSWEGSRLLGASPAGGLNTDTMVLGLGQTVAAQAGMAGGLAASAALLVVEIMAKKWLDRSTSVEEVYGK